MFEKDYMKVGQWSVHIVLRVLPIFFQDDLKARRKSLKQPLYSSVKHRGPHKE